MSILATFSSLQYAPRLTRYFTTPCCRNTRSDPESLANSVLAVDDGCERLGSTAAHTKSASYSNWRIDGKVFHLSFTVPLPESARFNQPGELQPPNESVEDSLATHLPVSAGGRNCPLFARPKPLAATAQFRRFVMSFNCSTEADIVLRSSAFFELMPSQVSLAQIQTSDGTVMWQLFTKDKQSVPFCLDLC